MPSILNLFVASVALGASLGQAAPAKSHVVHERHDGPRRAWIKRDRVQSDALLPVKIGLKQENLHRGYEWLMDVADPTSERYSEHWTPEEVTAAFAPHDDTLTALRSWLQESGIAEERIKHSTNKGWISFHATAAEAEELFKTEFYEHEHVSNGKTAVACDEYQLPGHILPHVDYVTPGVKTATLQKRRVSAAPGKPGPGPFMDYPSISPQLLAKNNATDCDKVITPACVHALYQIPVGGKPAKGNALGIFEDGDFYAQEDLDLFFGNFTPRIPKGTHPTLNSIDGGKAPITVAQAGGESDLDFQLAYPIVYPQEVVVYQVDDINYSEGIVSSQGFGNTFLDALDGSYCNYTAFGASGNNPYDPKYPDTHKNGYKGQLMCGTYKPTNVISISYGLQEDDLPANYQKRQCNEFMKLGLQGVSVFVASGDTGVAGTNGDDGNSNGCLGKNAKVFNPTNPNSCYALTNVGATMVSPGKTVKDPESAAWGLFDNGRVLFTSSGGFSNIYPIPDYQKTAVGTYFQDHNPPYPYYEMLDGFNASKAGNGIYNRIGRGIPDVAANGLNIGVYNTGKFASFGGTSASSPIFASVVTRINDARLNMGKKPIGFINPALYQNPQILNDITNGTNPGCGTKGFSAVKGWDPVTGLGTPNFPKMLEYFTSLK